MFTLKMENFMSNYLTNKITLAMILYRCHFNARFPSKMFYGSIGVEVLIISRETSKIEDLSHPCKPLLSQMYNCIMNNKCIMSNFMISIFHILFYIFTCVI